MRHEHIEQVLDDLEALRDNGTDGELEAVKVALLLEDVFAIHLLDSQIGPSLLDRSAVRLLIDRQHGAG